MSQQIHDLFSSIAPKYDLINRVLSLGIDRRWRREGVAYLKDRRRVLDLCAGTLALTKELLKVNPGCRITAIDFSEEMLKGAGVNVTATTICADFYQLDVPPLSYDGVMCAYGLRNLDDNPAALRKIYQLLTPGGRLVILEFFRPDRWYSWGWNLTYGQFVIPAVGVFLSRHRDAYRHLRDSVRHYYTLDQYENLLRETGFEVKVTKRQTGGISGLIVADKGPLPPVGEGI